MKPSELKRKLFSRPTRREVLGAIEREAIVSRKYARNAALGMRAGIDADLRRSKIFNYLLITIILLLSVYILLS